MMFECTRSIDKFGNTRYLNENRHIILILKGSKVTRDIGELTESGKYYKVVKPENIMRVDGTVGFDYEVIDKFRPKEIQIKIGRKLLTISYTNLIKKSLVRFFKKQGFEVQRFIHPSNFDKQERI